MRPLPVRPEPTPAQRQHRNRENVKALVFLAVAGVIFLWGGIELLWPLGLLWGVPILIAGHLGESRNRTGWL